jgi:ribosome assembly protein RRB1
MVQNHDRDRDHDTQHKLPKIKKKNRDDTTSIWDVSVERDEAANKIEEKFGLQDLPPQLLFLHQGQTELHEARWHPLIPFVVFSAAADGFHIWRASTL